MNIAIVTAEFNDEITSRMLQIAQEKAKSLKITVKYSCMVPGAYDMPILVDALLAKKDVDGVVTLGAIIKGQTKHDEVIANSTAKSLTELSLKHKKPVSLGISGPGMQERHAYARIRPVAERAVEAVAKLAKELEKIQ
ncbi:MAG: 6,7-dimethyl-8-ribityllumazine synthase [Nitrososphaeria archaeon]|nr:6,7-dimethyl-8-ribityllumazine synthase [Nitrososphaeria archaeon]NDB63778.1 6,7-dimethyl-8-ribityllumazine synthase [Nitrosopumilaceae archaeon]NDB88343.1 6,7-dimethyl-8-ribityllumazine synthase [Nitrososphaerota archaeon]NDB47111.1 6,7-dimethyl-8-ribityllumazine synthase [Nitrososphaeria archaeon]NDB90684.1 6,7-dimethyl-8-ribityllumazine synthase [Nitrososphaerota archaeon]